MSHFTVNSVLQKGNGTKDPFMMDKRERSEWGCYMANNRRMIPNVIFSSNHFAFKEEYGGEKY